MKQIIDLSNLLIKVIPHGPGFPDLLIINPLSLFGGCLCA